MIARCVGFVVLAAACARPVAPAVPATPIADPIAIPLRLIRDVPFVEVRVDDGPPAWFAVDTGAPISVIDSELGKRVHKRATHDNLEISGTTAGTFEAATFEFDGLRVGAAELDGVVGIETDLGPISEHVGIPLGGILGLSAFESYELTLDYPGRRIVLDHGTLPAPDGDQVIGYTLHNGHVAVSLALGGGPIRFELDSGSGYFIELARSIVPRVPVRAPFVAIGLAIGMTGVAEVTAARLDAELALGRHAIAAPVVYVSPDPSLETDGVARIGGPLLARFAVTIDQQLQRVRFARPGRDAIESPPLRASGVELVRPGATGAWTVAGFVPGTAGPGLGIQIGDVVVSLDGQPVDGVDAGAWSHRNTQPAPLHLVLARGDQRLDVTVPTIELVH